MGMMPMTWRTWFETTIKQYSFDLADINANFYMLKSTEAHVAVKTDKLNRFDKSKKAKKTRENSQGKATKIYADCKYNKHFKVYGLL